MVPLPSTALFCNFVLSTPFIKLSVARKKVVEEVEVAAIDQIPIDENTWNNFLLSTQDFYNVYLLDKEFNPPIEKDEAASQYFYAT